MTKCLALKLARLVVCILAFDFCSFASQSKADEQKPAEKPAADSMPGKEPGQVRDDNSLKMKLIWCPPGEFQMNETRPPRTPTTLTKGFWLAQTEATQSQWTQVMKTKPWNGEDQAKDGDDYPATFVSWDDADRFCRDLTTLERRAGRLSEDWEYTLPTEAQCERACQAQTQGKFVGHKLSELGDYAWHRGNALDAGEPYAHLVGQKTANAWGFFDLHGNVSEWCRDVFIWQGRPPVGLDPEVIPDGKRDGSCRVKRGGSWDDESSTSSRAGREGDFRISKRADVGFRVALCPVPPAKPAQ